MSESDLAIAQIEAVRDLTLRVLDRMGIPPSIYKRHDPNEAGKFVATVYREIFKAVAHPEADEGGDGVTG